MMIQAMPAATPVATAAGYLALLDEDDDALTLHALQRLLTMVDTLWHEVAEALPTLEGLAEGDVSEIQKTAAAVASRVLFHLQEPQQALRLAMLAQDESLLETDNGNSPYVEQLVTAAIDAYIEAKQQPSEDAWLSVENLQKMVFRLLDQACAQGRYQEALGIAMEAQEIPKVTEILQTQPDVLVYALDAAVNVVASKAFRTQCYEVIAQCLLQQFQTTADKQAAYYLAVVYQLLADATSVAQLLGKLMDGSGDDDFLHALQISFDIMDNGDQAFASKVAGSLEASNGEHASQVQRVLTGGFSAELALSFLYKHSHADRLIMENLKKSMEERSSAARSSVLHTSAVMTHAYLYAGTTNDSFLRDYLDWMKKASNWAKFSATASLGVVHAAHTDQALHLLEPYLPPSDQDTVLPTGGYAEGGALYALGLVHGPTTAADQRAATCETLRQHLRISHANEPMSHGAALGVGLTAMGSADFAIVNELKQLLDTDSAVAGEAAGVAMGLVLVGSGAGNAQHSLDVSQTETMTELVEELKNYARETQHEKIIRGIAMGLALMQFGQEENADALVEEMRSDRDPVMRYGAMYALSLAYCGTGSNKAVRLLLHTAVSDVSDDVRMAAVLGLAFVLFKTPERVPELVRLLLESFNPHVRYASCMAVGIAMAGTGDAGSIALLEPMLEDMTDYVRQGALMGTAMIYMQQSDTSNGRKIRFFREKLSSIVSEKHRSMLTKQGAILATGILDAGGRNCELRLGSRNGFTKMSSCVGLALWLQHWHWYPMMHMFSLALTPTLTIGLNQDFKFPKSFEIVCHSKPSAFAYPKKIEEKKEEKKKRVETVTLSTTAKEKARLARKRAKEDGIAMEVDKKEEEPAKEDEAMDVDEEEEKKKKKKRVSEPTVFRLSNPCRIPGAQSLLCAFDLEQRYRPVRPDETPYGVLMLTDSTPDAGDQDLRTIKSPYLEPEGELAPPEAFEWKPPVPPKEEESKSE